MRGVKSIKLEKLTNIKNQFPNDLVINPKTPSIHCISCRRILRSQNCNDFKRHFASKHHKMNRKIKDLEFNYNQSTAILWG